ncbi:MAG: hypothetical protein KF760_21235 [Candidatus Eremiobacteraeota bacterium]|nr:hypothetical protein [Candidatus Eremiobacteraeota bacterium]MCW5867279.1 hypothetical protein [Candidatus Eremiobacteraeota bacterium]
MSELQDPSTIFARMRPNRTDMDSFNRLVDTAADHLEGHSDVSEVEAQLAIVDQDLGHLRLQFENGLRFQVRTPELETGVALAYNAFRNLAQQFEKLGRALQAQRPYDVARQLEVCNATVNQLFWAFADLRQHLAEEKYSEAPFIQEVVRVGKAYVSGRLAGELFLERFHAFCELHDQFIEGLQPLLAEVEGDPRHQQLLDALEEQNVVLDEIAGFLPSGDKAQVDAALGRLCHSSAVLLELQQEFLKEPDQTTGLLCFRCGHANQPGEKKCANCQARLMDVQTPGTDSSYNDASLPANLRKLTAAAEGFRDGALDREAFLEVLNWYDDLTEQALQQMSQLAPPPEEANGMPEEQLEAYDEAVEAMQQGLDALKSGVARLRLYSDKQDPVDLEVGLESCLGGHQYMLRFAAVNESLKAKT